LRHAGSLSFLENLPKHIYKKIWNFIYIPDIFRAQAIYFSLIFIDTPKMYMINILITIYQSIFFTQPNQVFHKIHS